MFSGLQAGDIPLNAGEGLSADYSRWREYVRGHLLAD